VRASGAPTPRATQAAASSPGPASGWPVSEAAAARHAEEGDAEGAGEGHNREAGGEGEAGAGDDDQDPDQVAVNPEALEEALEDQPFADEAVQRR